MSFLHLFQSLFFVCLFSASISSIAPSCNLSMSADEVCADFCNYRCGFYNQSTDRGTPYNITLYRITPKNVTGIRSKNTGDATGDVGFFISKKNITQHCFQHPSSPDCVIYGNDLYGSFKVEVDGQFGPYSQCNPIQHGTGLHHPQWQDTQNFLCGQGCYVATEQGCQGPMGPIPKSNGTGMFGNGFECWCDTTKRHDMVVGREERSSPFHGYAPKEFPPQCIYYQSDEPSKCLNGSVYKTLTGWSWESTLAMACKACTADQNCTGWRTHDNRTVHLFEGDTSYLAGESGCTSGTSVSTHFGPPGWLAYANLGGYWYSTPMTGECPKGTPLGTNGCTWRVVEDMKYANASCVNEKVDVAVEEYGKICFDTCEKPLKRTSDCYLSCYLSVIQGDASWNLTKAPSEVFVKPWVRALEQDEPSLGGCVPEVPDRCEGPQCDPLIPPLSYYIV